MSDSTYPEGWDADRVKRLIDDYEGKSEDELVAEDEAATEPREGQTLITVPDDLLPAIRQLIASHSL